MIANLKHLRQQKGISQKQLADMILVSQQSVNKYENQNVEPDIKTLVKMADFFGVSLDYLVGRTDIKEMITKPKMSDLNETEAEVIIKFRSLTNKQQHCILSLIDSYK